MSDVSVSTIVIRNVAVTVKPATTVRTALYVLENAVVHR
jgi:hypothetical protein